MREPGLVISISSVSSVYVSWFTSVYVGGTGRGARQFPQKGQTLFLCPVENCDFYTTKEGFKDNSVANHLKIDHKVTAADMKPGKYKFKKVKREKCKKKL